MKDHAIACDECGASAVVDGVEVVSHPERPYQILAIKYSINCQNCGEREQATTPPGAADANPEPPH